MEIFICLMAIFDRNENLVSALLMAVKLNREIKILVVDDQPFYQSYPKLPISSFGVGFLLQLGIVSPHC